jgi:hypothetical protein
MPKRKPDPACCLCGLPYERIGNNPAPLHMEGRCCDACNEIVTEARIDPKRIAAELERVEAALGHMRATPTTKRGWLAVAAICASRGPVLWAKHKAELELLRQRLADRAPDDG